MRYASHLFLRVELGFPAAIAAAARAEGIGSSEFIRRAVKGALLSRAGSPSSSSPLPGASRAAPAHG